MHARNGAAVAGAVRAATRAHAAFELKGVMTSLTVMRLRSKDLNLIERQLRAKLTQMPGFFQQAPVVLDVSDLADGLRDLPLPALLHVLRTCGMVPVGIANVSDDERAAALAAGLGVIQPGAGRREEARPAVEEPITAELKPAPETTEQNTSARTGLAAHRPPLVIRQAVRSGQVIYAQLTDLIVMAPINPGAQIFADGHIHIYSTLRGRAMAGAQGLIDARIYCQKLEAELVAIAGAYMAADDVPEKLRGKPVQVYLDKGECKVAPL